MKCIKIIKDEDVGFNSIPFKEEQRRFGSRGIIFNDNHEVAVLHMKNKGIYKLIGGGIENGETSIEAFQREVLEETGYKIEIDEYIGTIDEFKSQTNFKQTSYLYVSHIIENLGYTNFTQKEIDDGSELLWLNIEDAIELIQNCAEHLNQLDLEESYQLKFIVRRDYEILNYYKNNYKTNKCEKYK